MLFTIYNFYKYYMIYSFMFIKKLIKEFSLILNLPSLTYVSNQLCLGKSKSEKKEEKKKSYSYYFILFFLTNGFIFINPHFVVVNMIKDEVESGNTLKETAS